MFLPLCAYLNQYLELINYCKNLCLAPHDDIYLQRYEMNVFHGIYVA